MFYFMNRMILAGFFFLLMPNSYAGDYPIKNNFISPEVQSYFETVYGYKNPKNSSDKTFRDSPISIINENVSIKNPAMLYSVVKAKNKIIRDNDSAPIYYSVKKAYSPGPLSSCVIEPDYSVENKLAKYNLVDVRISASDYEDFFDRVLLPAGFFMAGEESFKNGKDTDKIVFGWLPAEKTDFVLKDKRLKSFNISKRKGLKAPLTNITIVLKSPYDRNPAVFAEKFSEEIGKIGFVKESSSQGASVQGDRFSFIEIKGRIPLDKLDTVLSNPFVLRLNSNI